MSTETWQPIETSLKIAGESHSMVHLTGVQS